MDDPACTILILVNAAWREEHFDEFPSHLLSLVDSATVSKVADIDLLETTFFPGRMQFRKIALPLKKEKGLDLFSF